jgi:hypothetical protein
MRSTFNQGVSQRVREPDRLKMSFSARCQGELKAQHIGYELVPQGHIFQLARTLDTVWGHVRLFSILKPSPASSADIEPTPPATFA